MLVGTEPHHMQSFLLSRSNSQVTTAIISAVLNDDLERLENLSSALFGYGGSGYEPFLGKEAKLNLKRIGLSSRVRFGVSGQGDGSYRGSAYSLGIIAEISMNSTVCLWLKPRFGAAEPKSTEASLVDESGEKLIEPLVALSLIKGTIISVISKLDTNIEY